LIMGFTHVVQLSLPILLLSAGVGFLVSYFYPPQMLLLLDKQVVVSASFSVAGAAFRDENSPSLPKIPTKTYA
jgi:uncharacterized membrane protein